MNKILKGYVSSRSVAGQKIPQSIQNSLLRNYCIENKFKFALSATEYSPANSYLMLEKTINELELYDGIISYSIFQLPNNLKYRNSILKKLLKRKKIFCFVLEKIIIRNNNGLQILNEILKINELLPYCLKEIKNG